MAKNYSMRLAVLLIILAIGIMPVSVFGEASEIGFKQFPEKLLEYTDGTLQIYVESNGLMIPIEISGLKATSTDTDVIKIIGIESANEYITNIKILAQKPGNANIALAASGFMSKEVSIEVFANNNFPTQIQMKITPNDFPVDGPKHGFIGVELLTTSGLPTKAESDTVVKFSTPNNDMIKLKNDQVVIKQGEYFAMNEFEVLASGEPIIFAETEEMKRISKFIKIQESAEPLKIQAYAFPSTFTSYSNPTAFLVIQLQDDEGVPILAENDITVTITASNPDVEVNTSEKNFEEMIFSADELVIESGSYWAHTSFTPRPDLSDFTESGFQPYTITASADDYIATSTPLTVIHKRIGDGDSGKIKGGVLLGEGPAIMYDLPFLTTGKRELVGILALEATVPIIDQLDYLDPNSSTVFASIVDEVTLPVQASNDIMFNIASSRLATVSFENPIVNKGANSALVFGNTGTSAPKDCKIKFYLTDNEGIKEYDGRPYGPIEDSLSLNVESLIPMVLAGSEFPIIGYLMESNDSTDEDSDSTSCYSSTSEDEEDESGRFGVTKFIDDSIITFSANEYAEIEPTTVKQNQPYAMMTGESKKVGITTFDIRGSDLAAQFTIESHTTDPTTFGLAYPISALPDTTTLSAIQVFDSAGNPVYAKEDIEIILVSNDESVLEIPDRIMIPKDDYRTFFEINTHEDGDSEIAILSEDLPLAKFDMNVKGIKPKLGMDISGSGLVGEAMMATLAVSYPGINLSAENLDVKWIISGAEILMAQRNTNENGLAYAELISNNPSTANIKAVVNGVGISNAESIASYSFAHPEGYVEIVESDNFGLGGLIIEDAQLIYIIVPGAVAGAFLFLKRTNRLEGISERLPLEGLGEKFDGIKEKISDIRERD